MNSRLPLITALIVGLAYVWLSFQIVPLGDDLNFPNYYREVIGRDMGWLKFPGLHFLWSNGRLSDMLQPLWLLFMPAWLRALTVGATAGALCIVVPKAARLHSPADNLLIMFMIAMIVFTLRWDAIWMENVAFFCYVFPAVMVICAMLLWQNIPHSGWRRWLAIIFGFVAMTLHEAACAPVMAGMAIYLIITRRHTGHRNQLPMTVAMFAGAILSLCSPPAWQRLSPPFVPEPITTILGGSAFYVLILLIVILFMAILKPSALKRLAQSEWIIWVVSALGSTVFMIAAGYGGRTGWFAQIYALIALGWLVRNYRYRGLAWQYIIMILVTAHVTLLCVAQTRLSAETREVLEQYRRSPDGIVYSDQPGDNAMPFYLLGKTHGLPDADDVYYLREIARDNHRGDTLMTVLPIHARHIRLSALTRERKIASVGSPGDTLLLRPEPLPTFSYTLTDRIPRQLTRHNGRLYVQTILHLKDRETQLYLYTPLHEDRGEK